MDKDSFFGAKIRLCFSKVKTSETFLSAKIFCQMQNLVDIEQLERILHKFGTKN